MPIIGYNGPPLDPTGIGIGVGYGDYSEVAGVTGNVNGSQGGSVVYNWVDTSGEWHEVTVTISIIELEEVQINVYKFRQPIHVFLSFSSTMSTMDQGLSFQENGLSVRLIQQTISLNSGVNISEDIFYDITPDGIISNGGINQPVLVGLFDAYVGYYQSGSGQGIQYNYYLGTQQGVCVPTEFTYQVTQPSNPTALDGLITINPTPGSNPPHQFTIDNGQTWSNPSNFEPDANKFVVRAGTYQVGVRNSCGATTFETVTVAPVEVYPPPVLVDKYCFSFYDEVERHHHKIFIQEWDYEGECQTMLFGQNPITIEWANDSDILAPLKPSMARIELRQRQTGDYQELFQVREFNFRIKYMIDDQPFWTGWVLPDYYSYNAIGNKGQILELRAIDTLSLLEDYEYVPSRFNLLISNQYNAPYQSYMDVILDCLAYTQMALPICFISNLESNVQPGNDFLNQVAVDSDVFRDDGQLQSAGEVLEAVLKSIGCRIYQRPIDNEIHWVIERPLDLVTATQKSIKYSSDGVYQSLSTRLNSDAKLISTKSKEPDNYGPTDQNNYYTARPGLRKGQFNTTSRGQANLVDNHDFEIWAGNYPQNWQVFGSSAIERVNRVEDDGHYALNITEFTGDKSFAIAGGIRSNPKNVFKEENNLLTLSFDYYYHEDYLYEADSLMSEGNIQILKQWIRHDTRWSFEDTQPIQKDIDLFTYYTDTFGYRTWNILFPSTNFPSVAEKSNLTGEFIEKRRLTIADFLSDYVAPTVIRINVNSPSQPQIDYIQTVASSESGLAISTGSTVKQLEEEFSQQGRAKVQSGAIYYQLRIGDYYYRENGTAFPWTNRPFAQEISIQQADSWEREDIKVPVPSDGDVEITFFNPQGPKYVFTDKDGENPEVTLYPAHVAYDNVRIEVIPNAGIFSTSSSLTILNTERPGSESYQYDNFIDDSFSIMSKSAVVGYDGSSLVMPLFKARGATSYSLTATLAYDLMRFYSTPVKVHEATLIGTILPGEILKWSDSTRPALFLGGTWNARKMRWEDNATWTEVSDQELDPAFIVTDLEYNYSNPTLVSQASSINARIAYAQDAEGNATNARTLTNPKYAQAAEVDKQGTGGGDQDLQEVTDRGANTTNGITFMNEAETELMIVGVNAAGHGVFSGSLDKEYQFQNNPVVLTRGVDDRVSIEIDDDGQIIFTAPMGKNFHFSGDVIAYAAAATGSGSWWDNLPIATDTSVGAVKSGGDIIVNEDGTMTVVGGTGGTSYWSQTIVDDVNILRGSNLNFQFERDAITTSPDTVYKMVWNEDDDDMTIAFQTDHTTGPAVGRKTHMTIERTAQSNSGYIRMYEPVVINDPLTVVGDVTVSDPGVLNFGSTVRQMVNLYGTSYGLGVQSSTFYQRSGANFAWFVGGTHTDGTANHPGGGTRLGYWQTDGLRVETNFNVNGYTTLQHNGNQHVLRLMTDQPNPYLSFYKDDTRLGYIQQNSASGMFINTESFDRFLVRGNGNDMFLATSTDFEVKGTFSMLNGKTMRAQNSSGTYETFFWPRWTDDRTYLNFGSAGLKIRNSSSQETISILNTGYTGIGVGTPTQRLHIGGNILATGEITAYSDRRLKSNIRDLESIDSKFDQLKPVRYSKDDKEQIGLIAQNVQELFPEFVTVQDDDMGTLALDYQKMIALCIAEIQSLKKQLNKNAQMA